MNNKIRQSIILLLFFIFSINLVYADGFPASFFGIEVGKSYEFDENLDFTDDVVAEVIDIEFWGPFGPLSNLSKFKPKKVLPMFPILNNKNEESYYYYVTLPPNLEDAPNLEDESGMDIVVRSGWRMHKPFNGTYSYEKKLSAICEMLDADLNEVAKLSIPFERGKGSIIDELKKDKPVYCIFHRNDHADQLSGQPAIVVMYKIQPVEENGPDHETLDVYYRTSKDQHESHINKLDMQLRDRSRKRTKEKTKGSLPY